MLANLLNSLMPKFPVLAFKFPFGQISRFRLKFPFRQISRFGLKREFWAVGNLKQILKAKTGILPKREF